MPQINCLVCNTEFYAKPFHLSKGWGKYCSISCRSKAQLIGKTVTCFICSKQIYRSPKELKKSDSNYYFCTKKCQTVWRNKFLFSGKNHFNWKSGEASYRSILLSSGRELVCVLCKTIDKRILAVHHKDKNRQNNELSNLTWLCHNCHFLVHHDVNVKLKLEALEK